MSSTITTTESDMRNALIILSLTPFLKIGDYTENCHGYKNQCASIQSMLDTSIPVSPHEFKGFFFPIRCTQDSFVKDFAMPFIYKFPTHQTLEGCGNSKRPVCSVLDSKYDQTVHFLPGNPFDVNMKQTEGY